jgi:3'-phosphoadenosine 5'-phosphosulfate sulfotransferase (PAPS reductase)/FAD synthetase
MKTFISFSGGVESTAMCVLYGKDATAIWCDTGAEHEKMYERINNVENYIKKIYPSFNIIKLKPSVKLKGVFVDNLIDAVVVQRFMPSVMKRYCTGLFKITPIDNFLKSQGECRLLIGLNADETGRTGNLKMCKNVKYEYPLIDDGLGRSDCEDILRLHNLHPNFPAYMGRGGCSMCFFKSEKEYKAMYYNNRPEYEKMVEFEGKYQDKRIKKYAIMSSGKTLKELGKECESEMFKSDIFRYYEEKTNKTKSCGPFCMR